MKVGADDRRVRFVGLDDYVAAGGSVLRDLFTDTFNTYIDSGFGLLGGEVAFLSTTLVAIDVTLAALFWAWSQGEDILARLIKKTLYVGFFAFLIGNFQTLSSIVMRSFAGLGLKASAAGASAEDFLRPGKLAALGIEACKPILQAAAELGGFPGFFENIVQIVILLAVALLVIVAFFIIAVQVFVVLIEFKLVSLAGFVLVPFGLFGRTAFLAEKVLGNVIASGVKVMVLAVIVGIGSSLFSEFTSASTGQPTLEEVLAMALAALTLLGLSIFGPGIASGLVSGAPQLGAGAAVGTGLVVGGMAMAGAAAAQMTVAGTTALGKGLAGAGAAGGGAPLAGPSGGSPPSPSGPPGPSGPSSPKGGGSGEGAASTVSPSRSGGGDTGGDQGGGGSTDAPAWARDLHQKQALAHGAGMALHAVGSGDGSSGGAAPSLKED
ncbi:P-type conjugative transfer protein TrbL [Caulobacter sp. RHG1]|uniref:P-type conjugative transfer protein TrbL n=1 Tax=Caulobacter sp. (strain RHG1) TaxID=2545762 RepID=UPI00351ADA1F